MERRPPWCLIDFKFVKTESQAKLVYNIAETVTAQLRAEIHCINDQSLGFVKSGISDAAYRIGPKIFSGLVSERAQYRYDQGNLTRKQFTKEHPVSRNKTALDIISFYDYNQNNLSNMEITLGIARIYESGCQVHYVTKDENQHLKGFQQNHELTPEECYQQAGIKLVPFVQKPTFSYFYNGAQYCSQVELRDSLNISKYQVKKLLTAGIISRVERERYE